MLAERLHQLLLAKTVPHSAGPRAIEYLGKTLLMNVAKRDICLCIQATGDNCAIYQNGDMVPQAPTSAFSADDFRNVMGPVELPVLPQEDAGRECKASAWHQTRKKTIRQLEKITQPPENFTIPITDQATADFLHVP